jgi:hypothetical protein
VYKLIGILKRPDGVTVEAFHKWWLQEHATLDRAVGLALDAVRRLPRVAVHVPALQ